MTPSQYTRRRRRRRSAIRIDVGALAFSVDLPLSPILRGMQPITSHYHLNAPPGNSHSQRPGPGGWNGAQLRTLATLAPLPLPRHRRTLNSDGLSVHRPRSGLPPFQSALPLLHTTCRLLVSHVLSQLPPTSLPAPASPPLLLLSLPRSGTALMMVVLFSDDSEQLEEGREVRPAGEVVGGVASGRPPLSSPLLSSSPPPLNSSLRPFLREKLPPCLPASQGIMKGRNTRTS